MQPQGGVPSRKSKGLREIFGEDYGLRIPISTMVMADSWREATVLQTHLPRVPVPQMQCEIYRGAGLEGTPP